MCCGGSETMVKSIYDRLDWNSHLHKLELNWINLIQRYHKIFGSPMNRLHFTNAELVIARHWIHLQCMITKRDKYRHIQCVFNAKNFRDGPTEKFKFNVKQLCHSNGATIPLKRKLEESFSTLDWHNCSRTVEVT